MPQSIQRVPTPKVSSFVGLACLVQIVLIGFTALGLSPSAVAQETKAQTEAREKAENSAGIQKVEIGFNGRWCLGRWTPLWIQHQCANAAAIEIETMDGDGVPVNYSFQLSPGQTQSGLGARVIDEFNIETVVRVGRMKSYIAIVLKDAEQTILARKKIRFAAGGDIPMPLSSTTMLSLDFGNAIGLEDFVASSRGDQQNRISLHFDTPGVLPTFYKALDSVEHIYIGTGAFDNTTQWSPSGIEALQEWVSIGGNLLISIGKNGEQWFSDEGLLRHLLPGTFLGTERLGTTGQLEKFVGNDPDVLVARGGTPLTIANVKFDDYDSNDLNENQYALFARRAVGFGIVSFVMFDLENPIVATWNGRNTLIAKLVAASTGRVRGAEVAATSDNAQLGFTDLSGQLRVPLDQFEGVGFISFTAVALLVSAFILVIGPGDYFLLKYVIGRMQWTWLTFPVWVLLFSGLAYWIFSISKPSQPRVNHVELIDFDVDSKQSRGFVWTQTYSPQTEKHNFELSNSNSLCGELSQKEVGWLGLAGTGLGGMQTVARSSLFQSEYQCLVEENKTLLQRVPLQVASSKTLFANYRAPAESMQFVSNLKYDARIGTLTGAMTNPLDVELTDCVVFFRTKVFPLAEPVAAGGSVSLAGASTLSFENYLKPKNEQGQTNSNLIWDKEDINVPRIMNMMMFFSATGYDDLTNDLHGQVDLSSHLKLNQAVLMGRVKKATTPVLIDGKIPDEQFDTQWTFVRIIFPVEERQRR